MALRTFDFRRVSVMNEADEVVARITGTDGDFQIDEVFGYRQNLSTAIHYDTLEAALKDVEEITKDKVQ